MEKMEYEVKFLAGRDSGEASYTETYRGLSSSSTNVIRVAMKIADMYDEKMEHWDDKELLRYIEENNGEGTDLLISVIRNVSAGVIIYIENSIDIVIEKSIDWDRKVAQL